MARDVVIVAGLYTWVHLEGGKRWVYSEFESSENMCRNP